MSYGIPFDEVMKKPDNWDEDVDFDIMNSNHELLKPIMNKLYFSSMPKNPKAFSLVFSDERFIDFVKTGLKMSGIKDLERVVFCEYSREDKEKLISMGITSESNRDTLLVIYTYNKNTLFINVMY